MPYMKVGANKISDHNVMSPLKNDMKACQQCHTETPQWLTDQVIAIQDRTVSLMNRSGYACAVTAKLFETAHKAQEQGKKIDEALYKQAKDLYLEAFYRVIFSGRKTRWASTTRPRPAASWGMRWLWRCGPRGYCGRP